MTKKTITYGSLYLEINKKYYKINKVNSSVIDSINKTKKKSYIKLNSTHGPIINETFFKNKVDHVFRYLISVNNGSIKPYKFKDKVCLKFADSNYNDLNINFNSDLKSIVIVLESPHKDEFDSNLNPKGPAQGATGNNLASKLKELIENIHSENPIPDGEYKIVLVNPIPCQTSLNYIHEKALKGSWKTLRDKVWITLWDNNFNYKINFISTINSINPFIIINSCSSKIKDNRLDQFLIDNFSKNLNLYKTHHPSSWNNRHGMSLKALK